MFNIYYRKPKFVKIWLPDSFERYHIVYIEPALILAVAHNDDGVWTEWLCTIAHVPDKFQPAGHLDYLKANQTTKANENNIIPGNFSKIAIVYTH